MSDAILKALYEAIDPSRIDTDQDRIAFLARDALHPERLPRGVTSVVPLCVIRPQEAQEVVAVVGVANNHRIPVVPMGGGSGLMGGATVTAPGLLLDLCGLKTINIRPADRMADVGAGVTIGALNQAAAPYGLMCGHDPWTVSVATVGGTIGTNSLGYLGGKYGAMGDQLLGVEAVLPTGEMVRTRAVEKVSTGPALQQLFIGAEGCYGIVTRATLQLFPIPAERLLQAWEFPDFAAGFAAIEALFMAGLRPGLLDFGDDNPMFDRDPPSLLLVSYEGASRVAQAEAAEAIRLCKQHQGHQLPDREVRDFWQQRHALGDAYAEARAAQKPWHRQRPGLDYLHVALPPSAVLAYRRRCLEILAQHGLQAHQSGLWDYAGLFSLSYSGGSIALLNDVHRELLMLCQNFDGAMEYCHGVGLRLAPFMRREHGTGLEILRRLKRCLDPLAILNPGKLALDEGAAETGS
jgi:alkyldihydroxyacetonephosphate synthase